MQKNNFDFNPELASDDIMQNHEAFIMEECTCCLCGHDLHFEHQVDFIDLKVQESAACPKCQIVLRQREHILQ